MIINHQGKSICVRLSSSVIDEANCYYAPLTDYEENYAIGLSSRNLLASDPKGAVSIFMMWGAGVPNITIKEIRDMVIANGFDTSLQAIRSFGRWDYYLVVSADVLGSLQTTVFNVTALEPTELRLVNRQIKKISKAVRSGSIVRVDTIMKAGA